MIKDTILIRRFGLNEINSAPLEASVNTITESGWISAARSGEAWALERFYASYQAPIYRICYQMLGSAEDAEDAMQAAFVRGFRALAQFRGECSLKTWIYRIAVNEAVNALRKRKNTNVPMDVLEQMPGSTPDIPEQMAVHAALARIKADHRTVLILRYWEDLSYEEIAEVLSLPLSTIRMRLKRARDEFQKWYECDL